MDQQQQGRWLPTRRQVWALGIAIGVFAVLALIVIVYGYLVLGWQWPALLVPLGSAGFGGVFTLLGVAAGQLLEDLRRRRGEIRREVRAWVGGSTGGDAEERHFEVRFFNDRDVNIALWDPKVEFYEGDSLIGRLAPQQSASQPPWWIPAGPIDLPSRTSVYQVMKVAAVGELLEQLQRSDRATFVATVVPGGRQLVEPLRPWHPYEEAPA